MSATRFVAGLIALGTALTTSLAAQQAQAPKGATGQCTDSTYTTAKTQARACLKHGGVKNWFGESASAASAPASAPTAAAASASAPAPTKVTASKSQPKDATGQCTDGSYTTAKTQSRGCLKHGGVKTWFGAGQAPAAAASAPAAAPAAGAAPAPAPTVVKAAAPRAPASAPGASPAQAPANPTDVWVNLSTKAYHCPGTKYYGATKHGKYMSEADAKAAGFHASYGKACT